MITRKDIIQGTPEWMEIRHAKIGGTRSKGLSVVVAKKDEMKTLLS